MCKYSNKTVLEAFISNFIEANAMLTGNRYIILAGGYTEGFIVKIVNRFGFTDLPCLYSNQEADTCMVLTAINLSKTFERVVVHSDDNDVLVLLMYYCNKGMLGINVESE